MNNDIYEVDYGRWSKIIIKAQLIIATIVFILEVVNNALLYVTRSQGYGPDTIVEKLIRYLILTSVFNFGFIILSVIVDRKVKDEKNKRFILMFFTTLICTDVAFSHYQFSVTLAIFVLPMVICILYEDSKLAVFTLIISMIGDVIAVMARASDSAYNKDIGPEAAIALTLPVSIFIFAKIISTTLEKRRNELKEAIISAEQANASAEKMVLSMNMLETLASALDAKDKYTNGHSLRVSIYSTKLAKAIGMDDKGVRMLRYEALLHDIGKIGVPDAILNKPAKLTDVEFGLIKGHTVVGSDILRNMIAVPGASGVARYHHERYDGKGYPDGIKGEEIPLNARIVGIADAYDAMNSDRIYRAALSKEKIRQELINGRGTQFDPKLLDKFVELMDEHKLYAQETLSFNEKDGMQQEAIDDIKNVLFRFSSASLKKNAMYDFDKFYIYMRNIGLRYNRSVEVLQIDVKKKENVRDIPFAEVSDVVQIAIRKNIRSVDMYHKYSDDKHMIILLDAGVDNIDIIKKRIQFDYDASKVSESYELEFTINDYTEKIKQDNEK